MAIAAKLVRFNQEGGQFRLQITLTLTGNYVTGGDNLDLTPLLGQAGANGYPFAANNPPVNGDMSFSSPFIGSLIIGTALNNIKLKIISLATALEFAAGAYSAALLGDTNIQAELVFDKLQ